MDVREFPVLAAADEPLVRRLAVGLGDDSARVLAYLLGRAESPDFDDRATLLAVRVGTGLSRAAAGDALDRLEDRDLADATQIRDDSRGRPPSAWSAADGVPGTVRRTYDGHARALLDRAERFPDIDEVDGGERDGPLHSTDPVDAPTGTELRVALNWDANGLHAPLFAADETGAYDDRNLAVAFDERAGSRDALDAVATGDAALGVVGAGTVLRARVDPADDGPTDDGLADDSLAANRVVPLALLYQHTTAALYTLADAFDEPFERVAQVRGRRVGMPVESEVGLLGRLFLAQAGVLDAVELVDVTGEESEALLAGEVDVVTGSFADPRELDREGTPVESLLVADHFPIPGPAVVATAEALSERRDALAAFLSATTAGRATAETDPETTERALAAASARPPDREREKFERAVAEFDRSDAVRSRGWGWQRADGWDRLRTALERMDLLDDDAE